MQLRFDQLVLISPIIAVNSYLFLDIEPIKKEIETQCLNLFRFYFVFFLRVHNPLKLKPDSNNPNHERSLSCLLVAGKTDLEDDLGVICSTVSFFIIEVSVLQQLISLPLKLQFMATLLYL